MPTGTNANTAKCPPSMKGAEKNVAKFERRAAKALADAKAAEQAGSATSCKRACRKAEYLLRNMGGSLSAKMVAARKAYDKPRFRKSAPSGRALIDFAAAISLTRPGTEEIRIKAVDKKRYPDFRPLMSFGPEETTRQTLSSMCLKPLLPVQPNQFFTQNGGRPAAILRVLELASDPNYKVVETLDVKDYFPSIDQDWLKANLPIGTKVSTHVLCVEDHHRRARVSGCGLYRHAICEGSVLTVSRQGLPQGAVSSPMISDFITSEVLSTVNDMPKGIALVNSADNFVIFARSRKEMETAVHSLQDAFARHLAGAFRLVRDGTQRIADGFQFLGYRFRRTRGKVDISPTDENVEKFARKFDRLAARQVIGMDAGGKEMLRAVKAWRAAFREWRAGDFWILARLRSYDRALPDTRRALQAVFRKLVERHRRQISTLLAAPASPQY